VSNPGWQEFAEDAYVKQTVT